MTATARWVLPSKLAASRSSPSLTAWICLEPCAGTGPIVFRRVKLLTGAGDRRWFTTEVKLTLVAQIARCDNKLHHGQQNVLLKFGTLRL